MTPALLAALWTLPGVAMLGWADWTGCCDGKRPLWAHMLGFAIFVYLWPLFLIGAAWLMARDAWAGWR